MKSYLFYLIIFLFFTNANYCKAQKYKNGTRLLKGAEVLSNTPLQLDYVLENLSDTANVTSLHEGKTHLILNDGSGEWREWWFIQGHWQPKALTTTNTDTLIINNSTRDTLLIQSKDTIVRENNYKIDGQDGSLLCLKDSVPFVIPNIRMEHGWSGIGCGNMPWDIDFYLTISKDLPMKLTLNNNGLYFQAEGKNAKAENSIEEGDITFRASSESPHESVLSLVPYNIFMGSELIYTFSDKMTHKIEDDSGKNYIEFMPNHSYFRLETNHTERVHPYSELFFDKEKLEFRKGTVDKFEHRKTTISLPTIFSVGTNFNYLDNLKYNSQEKTFYVKNKIVFTDTDNNNVASIFVNPAKNDIEFTSNALGGEIISLLEISKMISKPNSGEFNPDDDGGLHVTPTTPTPTPTPTVTTYPILPTYLVTRDSFPIISDNALYLQLTANKEIFLCIKLNGISKKIKIE